MYVYGFFDESGKTLSNAHIIMIYTFHSCFKMYYFGMSQVNFPSLFLKNQIDFIGSSKNLSNISSGPPNNSPGCQNNVGLSQMSQPIPKKSICIVKQVATHGKHLVPNVVLTI